jgi:death-on-curing protein
MRLLSIDEVLFLHAHVIAEFGGEPGIRDRSLLESALALPMAGVEDQEAYPGLCLKTAVLLHSLANNHAFIDGNKRIAYAAAKAFLRKNGKGIEASEEEKYQMVMAVAEGRVDIRAIASWIECHCR